MVYEGDAFRLQSASQFSNIAVQDIPFSMDQRIIAECKVDGCIRYHGQRKAIINIATDMRVVSEPLSAVCHAFLRQIDCDQVVAYLFQEVCPPTEAWRNFQNSGGRQAHRDTR